MSRRPISSLIQRDELAQNRGVPGARMWSESPVTNNWSRVASMGEEPSESGPPEQPEYCEQLFDYEGNKMYAPDSGGRFTAQTITMTFLEAVTDPAVELEQQDANTWNYTIAGTFNSGDSVTINGPGGYWDWMTVSREDYSYVGLSNVTVCWKPTYYFTFTLDEVLDTGPGSAYFKVLVQDTYYIYYSEELPFSGVVNQPMTAYFYQDVPRSEYEMQYAQIIYYQGEGSSVRPALSGVSGRWDNGFTMNWVNDPDSNNLIPA